MQKLLILAIYLYDGMGGGAVDMYDPDDTDSDDFVSSIYKLVIIYIVYRVIKLMFEKKED